MKKILFFIDTLYQGGAETLVKDYSLLLDKKKFRVVVLCLRRVGSEYERILPQNGIEVLFLNDFIPFSEKSIVHRGIFKFLRIFYLDHLLVRLIVKRIKPDVIHGHLYIIHYLRWLDYRKVDKFFYTCHSEPQKYWHCKTKFSKREFTDALWLVKKRAMRFIALHDSMRQELNAMYGVQNTIVVNNGIYFSKFENPLPSEIVRKKIGVPCDAFVVGHVGRFAEVKNHIFLIKVFTKLLARRKDAFLLLVGGGAKREEIKSKIRELHIETCVKILDNRTDVPDIMNSMNVFAFPSTYEGLGIVLIEAQKIGLPCVASDRVPSAATISNLVTVLPLERSLDQWVDALCKPAPPNVIYNDLEKWNMNNIIKQLEDLYIN